MAQKLGPKNPEIGRNLCRVKGKIYEHGGYRKDILSEELAEKDKAIFICTVCEGIMMDASLSKDGKQVCYGCVIYNSRSPKTNPLANEAARSMILSLSCHCPLS